MSFFVFHGCTITPKPIKDNISSFDDSTPKQYNSQSGGFLGFDSDENGIITPNARIKYNNLILMYEDTFFREKGVKLKKDDGITEFTDIYGNKLFKITKEHLTRFIILNQWLKSNKSRD